MVIITDKTHCTSAAFWECYQSPLHFIEDASGWWDYLSYGILASFKYCLVHCFLGPNCIFLGTTCYVNFFVYVSSFMYLYTMVLIMGLILNGFSRNFLMYDQTWSNKRITAEITSVSCMETQERMKQKYSLSPFSSRSWKRPMSQLSNWPRKVDTERDALFLYKMMIKYRNISFVVKQILGCLSFNL